VAHGKLEDVLANENSLTADYLTGRRAVAVRQRAKGTGKKLTVKGARANNLKDVTAAIPLGTFTCITGVSGSGKSSFTIDTLYAGAARA
jgi:excinuclease ABC subunit A